MNFFALFLFVFALDAAYAKLRLPLRVSSRLSSRLSSRTRYGMSKMSKLTFEKDAPIEVPVLYSVLNVEDVQEGTEFLVEGRINGRLDIDLSCGTDAECVPLHISARPSEQAFVFNSKFPSRIYDIEERRYFFLEQETFIRVSIVIHDTYFEITVNDYWTKLYEFRMSPERIANLRIKGALVTELVDMLPPQEEGEEEEEEVEEEDQNEDQ
ncbi:unnamed protein product [Caenorhabditis nigoni]